MTEAVVEYLGALQTEQGASRNTLAAYRRDLTDFTEFLRRARCALPNLAPDDLVVYLDGEPVVSIAAFKEMVLKLRPGTLVKIEVRRGDRLVPVELTLGELPKKK